MKPRLTVRLVLPALFSSILGLVALLTAVEVRAAPLPKALADPPWGTNVRVNDTALGTASQSDVALAASSAITGEVYAIWVDWRNGSGDLYLARSTDGGKQWGASTRVNSSQNTPSTPDIALSSSHTLHAVWIEDIDEGRAILYARSTDSGQSWTTPIAVNDTYSGSRYTPAIAVYTDTVCIAWSDERNGPTRPDIYVDCSANGGLTWGTDTRVNDDSAGTYRHYHPDIAIASTGRIHVVWSDDRDGNDNIYYTHSLVGGGWRLNTKLNRDAGTATQYRPSVAASGDTVHVIWNDYRNGSSPDLFGNHSTNGGDSWLTYDWLISDGGTLYENALTMDSNGAAWAIWRAISGTQYIIFSDMFGPNGWGTDRVVITSTGTLLQQPAAAADSTRIYAAWVRAPNEDNDIDMAAWDGTAWGPPVQVNDEGEARQQQPAIATDGTTLYAAWLDYRTTTLGNGDIYLARSTDGGQTWNSNIRLSDNASASGGPSLALAGATLHAVWPCDATGYAAACYDRSTNGGQTWGADRTFSHDMNYATNTDVAASGQTVYVVWHESPNLYLVRSLDGGSTWSTTLPIYTATLSLDHPALTLDLTGTLHLAWEETVANGDVDVCYARSADGGQTWSTRHCFGTATSVSQQTQPDIAVRGNDVHLVWTDDRSGTEAIYHVASTDGGQTWGTPAAISEGGPATAPAIVADRDGTLYVAWQDARNGQTDIYYTRSTDGGQSWDTPGRVNDDTTGQPQRNPALAAADSVYAAWEDFRRINWDIYATSLLTGCAVPLLEVAIGGASTITTGVPITLTATVLPQNATPPVTYLWSPPPAAGQGTPQALYYWYTPGVYTVTLTASNCGGPLSDKHSIIVNAPPIPLPCIEGRIYYADIPLANVRVELIAGHDPQGDVAQETFTDATGRYRFCNLQPGPYLLKRYGPSSVYAGWVATSVEVGSSNLWRDLDLPKKMTLLTPESGEIVYTSMPTLTWEAIPEAGRYTVQLNRAGDWELILHRTGLVGTSYRVDHSLTWDTTYAWMVDAYTGTHWVGTTWRTPTFTLPSAVVTGVITVTIPSADVRTALHIEDAPEGVVVNKLIGDSTGKTNVTYVDVAAHVWSYEAHDNINVILSVPENRLGAPIGAWIRDYTGGSLTPASVTNLGNGRYQVTVDLRRSFWCYICPYSRQVVWRFRIPNNISPQELTLQSYVWLPGYLTSNSYSDATLRLVRFPTAIIVANRNLLYAHHGDYWVTRLLEQLYTVAQGPPYNNNPLGVIYYVERYNNTLAAWDNTAINYASETTANAAASQLDALIDDWVEDGSDVITIPFPPFGTISIPWQPTYLLIVGNDAEIPFYRYDDPSDGEANWGSTASSNPAIRATGEDYILTDAPYADRWGGTDWQEGSLELAVGRLLGETAADMLNLLNSSLATEGHTGRAVMASVDGWELGMPENPACGSEIQDVLNVPARLAARGFNVLNDYESPRTVDVLGDYPSNWNSAFRSAANGGMDIFFIGGHNGYDHASIPGDDFSPDDTCAATTCRYHRFDDDHPIALIVGCHGGLPVPDVGVAGGADHSMVYDLVHEGARAFIGATGYSYGSPGSLCSATWGERLIQHFFDELLPPRSRSLPVGMALQRAKAAYVFGIGSNDALDRKTITEFNLYGVPWQRLTYPGSRRAMAAMQQVTPIPSAAHIQTSPIARTAANLYTRTITVTIANYTVTQIITGGVTYDILSIPGGSMAIAPDTPLLPYIEGFTFTLPISATVQNITLITRTCTDAGAHEVPIVIARPWTEGGTTFTTTTTLNTFYPADDALVHEQQQGNVVLITLYPIQHNPTTNATRFCSQMILQVAYEAPIPLAVDDLSPQQEQVVPGETITVTTSIENVSDALLTLTATLTLLDPQGNAAGWQTGGPFAIAAGQRETLSISWSGSLPEGSYTLMLTLWHNGRVVGTATGKVHLIGGALTALTVPTNTVMPGQQASFGVTFANYRTATITPTVRLTVYDSNDTPIATFDSQETPVNGNTTRTFTFTWKPDHSGLYTLKASVESEDNITYGPAVQTFRVGYTVYLPLVLRGG